VSTIRRIFKEAADGNLACVAHRKGAGRPKKLARDNEGLKAGFPSLFNLFATNVTLHLYRS